MGVCVLMNCGACSARDPATHAASSVGGALPPPLRRAQEKLTPLHLAASNGHVEVVELLLEQGANIEAEDKADDHVSKEGLRLGCVYVCSCMPAQEAFAIPLRTLRARLAARSHRRRAAHRTSGRRCISRWRVATWRW